MRVLQCVCFGLSQTTNHHSVLHVYVLSLTSCHMDQPIVCTRCLEHVLVMQGYISINITNTRCHGNHVSYIHATYPHVNTKVYSDTFTQMLFHEHMYTRQCLCMLHIHNINFLQIVNLNLYKCIKYVLHGEYTKL